MADDENDDWISKLKEVDFDPRVPGYYDENTLKSAAHWGDSVQRDEARKELDRRNQAEEERQRRNSRRDSNDDYSSNSSSSHPRASRPVSPPPPSPEELERQRKELERRKKEEERRRKERAANYNKNLSEVLKYIIEQVRIHDPVSDAINELKVHLKRAENKIFPPPDETGRYAIYYYFSSSAQNLNKAIRELKLDGNLVDIAIRRVTRNDARTYEEIKKEREVVGRKEKVFTGDFCKKFNRLQYREERMDKRKDMAIVVGIMGAVLAPVVYGGYRVYGWLRGDYENWKKESAAARGQAKAMVKDWSTAVKPLQDWKMRENFETQLKLLFKETIECIDRGQSCKDDFRRLGMTSPALETVEKIQKRFGDAKTSKSIPKKWASNSMSFSYDLYGDKKINEQDLKCVCAWILREYRKFMGFKNSFLEGIDTEKLEKLAKTTPTRRGLLKMALAELGDVTVMPAMASVVAVGEGVRRVGELMEKRVSRKDREGR